MVLVDSRVDEVLEGEHPSFILMVVEEALTSFECLLSSTVS